MMKKLLLAALLLLSLNSFSQTMMDVATGEYTEFFVKSDSTVWGLTNPVYNTTWTLAQISGLTGIKQCDGGQYTSIFLKSDGTVHSIEKLNTTYTDYATDYTNAAFTADTVAADWRMGLAIKSGILYYWSLAQQSPEDMLLQFGTLSTAVPKPRALVQPGGGRTIRTIAFGGGISPYTSQILWAVASDSTLWQWDQTHTTPFQVVGKTGYSRTWTGKVVAIAVTSDARFVVTSTNQVWVWGYNGGNYGGHWDYQNLDMDSIQQNMTGAGIVFPLKQIIANENCIQLIDANNNKWGIGNNQEGTLGSGYMSPSWRTSWNGAATTVYAYDFLPSHGLQSTWLQQPGKYSKLKTNPSFVAYTFGQDMVGNWYSWGRGGKAGSLGNQFVQKNVDPVTGYDNASKYPDNGDIPGPRLVTPLTQGTFSSQGAFDPATAKPPLANAGINQYLGAGVTSTTLYGQASHQNQPTNATTVTMSYAWTKTSGPNTPTITSPTSQNTTVTGLISGTYVFRNTVTNSVGATDYQEVTVQVSPTANAGADQTITLPTSSVTLDGTASTGASTYSWTRISGPNTPTIVSSTSVTTSVTGLIAGTYVFQLSINSGASTDQVSITVNAAPSGNCYCIIINK